MADFYLFPGPKGRDNGSSSGNTGGGNPPGDSELERRVEALEKVLPDLRERLVRVETKLDSMEKNMATKADLDVLKGSIATDMRKALNDQTWRFIGVAGALAGLAFTAAKFIH
ncbi:hypothetical protein N7403_32050 [Pseudomonas nitroreducens]|uniref:hypothetical protein n=1 Tax=Pseudomonas nitroreducens TaxID=46680 RepID=UPI00244875FB|nr:hypothetical protein [Pseudomonas nitroreducens]MDG9858504.1 hypothetical protein [Pseudomonas nitroreducens]